MTPEPSIRPMSSSDAPAVARVHLAAFPGYFLSRLGPAFLAVLYRHLADDPQAAVSVAQVGDGVVGFAAGVLDRRRFLRAFALRCGPALAACATARCMAQPKIAWELAARLPRALRGGRAPGECLEAATLLSIGVAPEVQGQGIGRRVVAACLQGLRAKGARRVLLETDADNAAANAFYLRCGFRLHREVRVEGARAMAEYLLELP